MQLTINGERRRVDVDPARNLLSVLRDDLDLTGTKYGCGEGVCGACTVLVDGQPVRSCVLPIGGVRDAEVQTIEGVARGDDLHPVQQAFLDAGAMQCGYCTPGMVMAAMALLSRDRDPDEGDVVAAMNGNICRCGTYPRIVAAVRRAASALRGDRR